MDVKTITDIVKTIASVYTCCCYFSCAPGIDFCSNNYDIVAVVRFNYYVINLPLLTSAFPVIFPQTTVAIACHNGSVGRAGMAIGRRAQQWFVHDIRIYVYAPAPPTYTAYTV